MSDAHSRARRDRHATLGLLALLVATCAIGIAVPAGLGWDFANFYDAGRKVAAGQIGDLYDPDAAIAGAPPQGTMAFWSTPLSAAFYTPLAAFAPETALVLFKLEGTLACWLALALLYLRYRGFAGDAPEARDRFALLFVLACVLYQPFWTVYRVGGQTTASVLLLLTLGLLLHVRERLALSALCFALAVVIKPALVSGFAFLVLLAGVRFGAWAALAGAALAGLSVATMGWPIHEAFLARALEGGSVHPWTSNSSLFVPIETLRRLAEAAGALRLEAVCRGAIPLLQLAVVGVFAWLALRGGPRDAPPPARRHFEFQMALVFFLMTAPTLWEHYLALLFPLLAWVIARRAALPRAALRGVGAILVLALAQNVVLVQAVSGAVGASPAALLLVSCIKSAPLALGLLLLVRHRAALWHGPAADEW